MKVVTFGEIMLRLSTPDNNRIGQCTSFDVNFGGAEANVGVCLANFGYDVSFVTKLPENPLGDSVCASLRKANVNTDKIVRGGNRLGVYYLETGTSLRPSSVIYDRANSAFAEASAADFDFDNILKDADLFCISGITPAISENTRRLAKEALCAAKRCGVLVSLDINFRRKLWGIDEAKTVLSELAPYADICFANSWDAKNLLSVDVDEDAPFEEGARKMCEKYGFSYVAASERVSHSASNNDLSASIYSAKDGRAYTSKTYNISPITDRVGGGDSFSGGVLCGILDGKGPQDIIEFAVAVSALKHTTHGDFCMASRQEAEALMSSGSLAVQR